MTTAHELETIGKLEVTDENGETHTVVIRREDLTTTNGAYRAIRDTVADTLSLVLSINREDSAPAVRTCKHCERNIVHEGGWVDPEASGDDVIWRDTCDKHDTFFAEHEPSDV